MTTGPSRSSGIGFALASAALFGISTPLAKLLLGQHTSSGMLAGLLYLGSGVGLCCIGLLRPGGLPVPRFRPGEWGRLLAANAFGGVLAPLLFVSGLRHSDAASAALLLNFEAVLTAVLAWVVFREHTSARVVLGMFAISLGGVALTVPGAGAGDGNVAAHLAIVAACLCWAIDNNLTRGLSGADAVFLASLKGLSAGCVNVGLALWLGASVPVPVVTLLTLSLGLAGYGLSLVLFILALRELGTARTGAYFATAPFLGAAVSVLALGEPAGPGLQLAGALMGAGLWLHLSERHDHRHTHEGLTHEHAHVHDPHDPHHQHDHADGRDGPEPHSHPHTHAPLTHSHPHFPDLHHRHTHLAAREDA